MQSSNDSGSANTESMLGALNLLTEYTYLLDNDMLEGWAECFTPDGYYKITSTENEKAKLPGGYLVCEGQPMLRDRVSYLRRAAIHNVHADRHFLSQPRVRLTSPDVLEATTNFMVYQSEPGMETRLFCAGVYRDELVRVNGVLRFKKKIVVLDNYSIMPLLSNPL